MIRRRKTGNRVAVIVLLLVCGWPASAAEPMAQQDEVTADIAHLEQFHAAAKLAARRLVETGPEVVPRLHQALLDPASNDHQRVQLIGILGEIGEAESVDVIVQAALEFDPQPAIRDNALLALADLPQTPAAVELATRSLERAGEPREVQRRALAYFGQQRDERGQRFVAQYLKAPEADLQAAALYLAARLGDESAGARIVAMLQGPPAPSLRYALLTGLAELATPGDLQQLVPPSIQTTPEYAGALRIAALRTAAPGEKDARARELIESDSPYEQKIGVRYLANSQGVESLSVYLGEDAAPGARAVARHQLRRDGYRVETRGGKVKIERNGPR